MTSEIERIAAGLTEAQRKILFAHKPGLDGAYWRRTSAKDEFSWNISGRKMREMGLIRWAANVGEETVITSLGKRVRAHLEQARHD